MEEVGARVAPPVFNHGMLSSPIRRKRDLCHQKPPPPPQKTKATKRMNWNPDSWDWDCARFVAKPSESEIVQLRTDPGADLNSNSLELGKEAVGIEEDESLELNLGGGLKETPPQPTPVVSRPSKRVRWGSPGGRNYTACQVDNCKEDLSSAKDYHRRHKVCELHSKTSKALVGKQMQRFCQQCSRFHLLSEFDEGRRSCRRRLAGHNRRRRKIQPEDIPLQLVVQGNQESASNKSLDLANLLAVLAHAQGKTEGKRICSPSVPKRDQLIRILDLASKLQSVGSLTSKITEQPLSNHKNETNVTSPSTMDLLAVLSATQTASSHNPLSSMLSQRSSEIETAKSTPDTRSCLELQLFTSSPEIEHNLPNLESSKKYFSSGGSNPIENRSPSSSPDMKSLFLVKNCTETVRSERKTIVEDTRSSCLPLEMFSGFNRDACNGSRYQSGYSSSSGSDHSPSTSNSDAQERTGQIIFKLFGKDPSDLPGTLRTQIFNWLSNSPSEMESYIRPGCVVLSVYVSTTSTAWDQLERSLFQRVNSLIQDSSDSNFWRKGKFLVSTGRQLASYKSGKVRLCKSWRSCSSPELISVSPLAVVAGQETNLLIKGRNLTKSGTKIHCAYMGKYTSAEVTGSASRGSLYEEINLNGFKIQGACPSVLGRCFIEVENGFKSTGFPVIIADATICRELKHLEYEFNNSDSKLCDVISYEHAHGSSTPGSKEEVLHFLNELGWLFQRKETSSTHECSCYSLNRFKFLLIFSVERDYTALVNTLLDMLVKRNSDLYGLSNQALKTLAEVQLLNRAVKRRCTDMAKILVHYSISVAHETTKMYIFPPNIVRPGGLTPLHLAACASGSDDMIDVLTNDPQQIGLSSWNSLPDSNGQSPYNYAKMRNNHSYNTLVAHKLAYKRNSQVSVGIFNETDPLGSSRFSSGDRFKKSCERCTVLTTKYSKGIRRTRGFSFGAQPYIQPLLAVAAVCVCVCLIMRALPHFSGDTHFVWERLASGTI